MDLASRLQAAKEEIEILKAAVVEYEKQEAESRRQLREDRDTYRRSWEHAQRKLASLRGHANAVAAELRRVPTPAPTELDVLLNRDTYALVPSETLWDWAKRLEGEP